jgi:hypothetical protein
MRKVVGIFATGVLLLFVRNGNAQNAKKFESCTTARGRYGIYVDGDRLWIIGSKHLIEVVSDELDADLEKRGWESTVAYGQFTVCARRTTDPKQLTVRDQVSLKQYDQIVLRPR